MQRQLQTYHAGNLIVCTSLPILSFPHCENMHWKPTRVWDLQRVTSETETVYVVHVSAVAAFACALSSPGLPPRES